MNDKVNNVNIAEKLMAVRLNCSFSFGHTTDRQITAETNANKQTHSLRVQKELLPGPSGVELHALKKLLSDFYLYHKKVTMSGMSDGERLLPVAFYLDYMNEYGVYQPLVEEKFQEFHDAYPRSIVMAQPLLNAAYNPADYPKQEDLRKYLNFNVLTLPLPDAGTLLDKVGEGIQEDVNTFLTQAVSSAFSDVNARIRDRLEKMSEILSNPKGRVHDSLLDGLKELVSFIPEFNVTQDDSLTLLAEEIKAKLLVHTTDSIKDKAVRLDVAAQAQDILRRMGV